MKFFFLHFFLSLPFLIFGQENQHLPSLSYSISLFNSDTCCWRKLSAEGADEAAGHLILAYYHQNRKQANKQAFYWHAGQCFAMAEEKERAKKYMRKTYSSFYRWIGGEDGRTWYYYANGTVAFIDRDKKKLQRMIEKWNSHYSQDLNYQALLQLVEHWELPYAEINRKGIQL